MALCGPGAGGGFVWYYTIALHNVVVPGAMPGGGFFCGLGGCGGSFVRSRRDSGGFV